MTDPGGRRHPHARRALGPSHPRRNHDDADGKTVEPGPGVEERDFEAIFRDSFDFVYRSVRRLGVPDAFADDAVQEVFMVAFRRWEDFEGRSKPRTWLFGIALRVARNQRRRIVRKDQHDRLPEQLVGGRRDPESDAQAEQAHRFLQEFLDGLDEAKRSVFILAELEQASAPEIADILEVPVNTVYSRLRSARKAFEAAVERLHAKDRRARP